MAHPEQPVSAGSIWMHYKHFAKESSMADRALHWIVHFLVEFTTQHC